VSLRQARALDPLPIGIGVIALVVLLFWVAFNLGRMPLLGGGTTYTAAFSEAAGLQAGNDVLVGGIKVGEVQEVALDGTVVRVAFTVDGARVGSDPELTIGIGTLLGNKFLDLAPSGDGEWEPDEQIPLERTTAPYDVIPAFADLTGTIQQIDTAQVAEAFTTLADTFRDAPPHLRGALDGMSRLATSITSRDTALAQLLAHAESVTGTLAERREQLTTLMGDGSLLLQEIDAREQVISDLLVSTAHLAEQLRGLVRDNEAVIGPALQQLREVTSILVDYRAELEEFLHLIYPTTRMLVDTTGAGPWFDGILGGVTPVPEIEGLPVIGPVMDTPRTLGELLGIPSGLAP
jgi:phospholipid/cholesterol/gamma-HCH transport system substrate-binding protein